MKHLFILGIQWKYALSLCTHIRCAWNVYLLHLHLEFWIEFMKATFLWHRFLVLLIIHISKVIQKKNLFCFMGHCHGLDADSHTIEFNFGKIFLLLASVNVVHMTTMLSPCVYLLACKRCVIHTQVSLWCMYESSLVCFQQFHDLTLSNQKHFSCTLPFVLSHSAKMFPEPKLFFTVHNFRLQDKMTLVLFQPHKLVCVPCYLYEIKYCDERPLMVLCSY